ncbi:MAG: hypothetical protein JXR25_00895 [Pontiellaceae bacterium]|nr:hypothetical protein [Pontiellaceae bacterium]MBN2783356.1 hypothetical protein [Pontiellaceae bacterium]
MIGQDCQLQTEQDIWSDHLHGLLDELNLARGTEREHLVHSIAMYCRHFHPHGLQQSDLMLLIARALCAINDRASAAQVLRSVKPHARHVERWLEILSELHHFPSLLPYFSLGVIRPADWAGAELDRMWTLDLGRLVLSESEKHEMMLYRSLRTIVESMLVFWDATGGEGVLGLKGLASFNVESGDGKRQTLTGARDLLGYIERILRQQQDERGWTAVPETMNLDL